MSDKRKGFVCVYLDVGGREPMYLPREEFWKLYTWHHLSEADNTVSSRKEYRKRANDIYELCRTCKHHSGNPASCYAVHREFLAIIKNYGEMKGTGWEQFSNLLNADPDFRVRCVMLSRRMVKASNPFRGPEGKRRVMIDGMSKWAHVDTSIVREGGKLQGRRVYGNPPYDGKYAKSYTLDTALWARDNAVEYFGIWVVPMDERNKQLRCAQGFRCLFRFPNGTMPFILHEFWSRRRYQ